MKCTRCGCSPCDCDLTESHKRETMREKIRKIICRDCKGNGCDSECWQIMNTKTEDIIQLITDLPLLSDGQILRLFGTVKDECWFPEEIFKQGAKAQRDLDIKTIKGE